MKRQHAASDLDPRSAEIVQWRRLRLLSAGFSSELADEVASDLGTDVHALLELIDRGCAPELAVRITAPLDLPRAGETRDEH